MDFEWSYLKTYIDWEVWYTFYCDKNKNLQFVYKLVNKHNYRDVYPTKKVYSDLSLLLQDAIDVIVKMSKCIPHIQKIEQTFPDMFKR